MKRNYNRNLLFNLYTDAVARKRKQYFEKLRWERHSHILNPNQSIHKYGQDILDSKHFKESGKNIQHGNMSVRKHSMQVAKYSLILSSKLRLHVNRKDIVRGALLHDYFLYDWHSPENSGLSNLHGFYHPGIALENAKKDYKLNARQKDIIKNHMWPLTVVPPKSKEAWVVSAADKYCSLMETTGFHKGSSPKKKSSVADNLKTILR